MDNNRPQTFDEALNVINHAMQVQGAGLKELLSSDYSNLRSAIEDLGPRISREVQATAGPAVAAVDKQVRANPYLYLGGIAIGAIAVGYLFGRSRATRTTEINDYSGLTYGDVQPSDNAELA